MIIGQNVYLYVLNDIISLPQKVYSNIFYDEPKWAMFIYIEFGRGS